MVYQKVGVGVGSKFGVGSSPNLELLLGLNLEFVSTAGAAVGSKVGVSVGWKFGIGVSSNCGLVSGRKLGVGVGSKFGWN